MIKNREKDKRTETSVSLQQKEKEIHNIKIRAKEEIAEALRKKEKELDDNKIKEKEQRAEALRNERHVSVRLMKNCEYYFQRDDLLSCMSKY